MADPTRPRGAIAGVSLILSLAAAALILLGADIWAGVACAAATITLALQGQIRWTPRGRFYDASTGFVFDAAVLAAAAWSLRGTWAGNAALIALVTSLLADYLVARGRALGYLIDDGIVTRFLRGVLISLAFLTLAPTGWLWAAAAVSTWTAIVRGSQMPKRELAAG